MTPESDPTNDEARRLFRAFVERASADDGGETISFDSFCAQHPEYAERFRDLRREERGSAAPEPELDADELTGLDQTLVQEPGPLASTLGMEPPAAGGTDLEGTLANAEADRGRTLARADAVEPAFGLPKIPDVTLEREIGRGGMGVVYVGKQTYLERVVAVKVLKSEGKDFADRFKREAKILASLSHPHIVACYQAGALRDGQCYLVMEYIDGPNLHQFLSKHGAAPVDRALEICAHVAEALDCAHRQTIIHRDVKPANVLLQRRPGAGEDEPFPYVAKLADLGLARPTSTDSTQFELTMKGAVMGSPPTMAPEQFDDPQSVDYLADIYGLGCVLFHLVTGRVAFPQTTLTATITSKMRNEAPDPREARADLPKAVAEFVRAMIARDRRKRPQSYAEIVERCRELARDPGPRRRRGASRPAARGAAAPSATPRVPKGAVFGALAVVGLVIVGAVGFERFGFGGDDGTTDGATPGTNSSGGSPPVAAGSNGGAATGSDDPSGAEVPSRTEDPESVAATADPPAWPGLEARFAAGTDHEGRVAAIELDRVRVTLADGVQGLIAPDDLSWIPGRRPADVLAEGDLVAVRVLAVDAADEVLRLGRKQRLANPWPLLAEGQRRPGTVRAVDAAGADVELESGLVARLPASELSWTETTDDATRSLARGDAVEVVVTDVDEAGQRIAVSLRRVDANPWDDLRATEPVTGTVERVEARTATIALANGLRGRLDVADWSHTEMPADLGQVLREGDEVEVVVLDFDADERRLTLGRKQLERDPWTEIAVGDGVRGTVRSLWSDGAEVELENGLRGTLPAERMSWTALRPQPADFVQRDQAVECIVVELERGSKTLVLSLRGTVEDPWNTASGSLALGAEHRGTVTEYGRVPDAWSGGPDDAVWFVRLANGFEGALTEVRVGDDVRAAERLDARAGEDVDVAVAGVDPGERRLELALLLPPPVVDSPRAVFQLAPALAPGERRSLIGRDAADPLAAWEETGHEGSSAQLAMDDQRRVVLKGYLDRSADPIVARSYQAGIEMPAEDWELEFAFGVFAPQAEIWQRTVVMLHLVERGLVMLTLLRSDDGVRHVALIDGQPDPAMSLPARSFDDYNAADAVPVRLSQSGGTVTVTWGRGSEAATWTAADRIVKLEIEAAGPRSFVDRLDLTRP